MEISYKMWKKLLPISLFFILVCDVYACSCGWGEYYYPSSKLVVSPIEPSEFYSREYGSPSLSNINAEKFIADYKYQDGHITITTPLTEKHQGKEVHILVDSTVYVEKEEGMPFQKASLIEKMTFQPQATVNEITARLKTTGESYKVHALVLGESGKILAASSYKGLNPFNHCSRDVYVKSLQRAKELDAIRKSGCYQYKKAN